MPSLTLYRYAFSLGAAAALLAGCGGAGMSGEGNAVAATTVRSGTDHSASSSTDLLYVTTPKKILMVSYPGGQLVGTIPVGPPFQPDLCSDPNNGNVFVTGTEEIVEYAHGGTTPISTLTLPTHFDHTGFVGCAVDPVTGNLAAGVGGAALGDKTCGVLVYPNAQGTPSFYTGKRLKYCPFPAYDGSGNLFLSGATSSFRRSLLMELRPGQSAFTHIKLQAGLCPDFCALQWDGEYLVARPSDSPVLYQIAISRTTGTLIGQVQLESNANTFGFYIKGDSVFSINSNVEKHNSQSVSVWPYPAGGEPITTFYDVAHGKRNSLGYMTYSVASAHARIRN
jgi:hypothetical protein